MRVAVMGAGSWGSVFSMILADAGCDVSLWARSAAIADDINSTHINHAYFPELTLPKNILATTNPDKALTDADLVVLAMPAQTLRGNLSAWSLSIPTDSILVSLIKGVELGTAERMTEVIAEITKVDTERVAVVSGPNLAHEIAAREPAATTVACINEEFAIKIQDACTTDYFRPYYTTDVVGVEIAGAVKNVIAIGAGLADGLGFGANARTALITRGLAELTRLGAALHADPKTFMGMAGLGDLVLTCTDNQSRNRRFGVLIGQGKTIDEACKEVKQVVEGIASANAVYKLAQKHSVSMPIVEAIYSILHRGKDMHTIAHALLTRSLKEE